MLALLAMSAGVQAGDRIWTGLVLATEEEPAKPAPGRIEQFAPTLERTFGYNTFYLLGEKTKDLHDGAEDWLVPSKRIFLKATVLEVERTGYRLQLDLYDGAKLLVTTEARLAKDAPLYIRGPAWGKGQLLSILAVR
jgi:hypothetical protein